MLIGNKEKVIIKFPDSVCYRSNMLNCYIVSVIRQNKSLYICKGNNPSQAWKRAAKWLKTTKR